jgi:hypothetical protein
MVAHQIGAAPPGGPAEPASPGRSPLEREGTSLLSASVCFERASSSSFWRSSFCTVLHAESDPEPEPEDVEVHERHRAHERCDPVREPVLSLLGHERRQPGFSSRSRRDARSLQVRGVLSQASMRR